MSTPGRSSAVTAEATQPRSAMASSFNRSTTSPVAAATPALTPAGNPRLASRRTTRAPAAAAPGGGRHPGVASGGNPGVGAPPHHSGPGGGRPVRHHAGGRPVVDDDDLVALIADRRDAGHEPLMGPVGDDHHRGGHTPSLRGATSHSSRS